MEKPEIRASSFTGCVSPRRNYLPPPSSFLCSIIEECASKSANSRDLQVYSTGDVNSKLIKLYASTQDGSQSYIVQQLEKHISGFLLFLTSFIIEECVLKADCLRDIQVPNTGDVSAKWIKLYASAQDGSHSYTLQQLEKHISGFLLSLTSFIIEECVLKSACLRDIQVPSTGFVNTKWIKLYASAKDGTHSYMFQQLKKHISDFLLFLTRFVMEECVLKSACLRDLQVPSTGVANTKFDKLFASAQDETCPYMFLQLEKHISDFLLFLTSSSVEKRVSKSACLRDLQVPSSGVANTKWTMICASPQDGSHSYMFQQPNTCGFPITLLAVYEPPEEIGNINVRELNQNRQQNDDYEEFNGDNPKLRVYNVRNWVECSRNQSLRVIGANFEGMILYVDPRLGYVYLDLKTGAKIYLPPYDDVEIGSDVMGTWTGTPGSTDCITLILDQFSMNNHFIRARQYTERNGWICVELEFKIVADLPDDSEDQYPLYAMILHGERLHILCGFQYACFTYHVMDFQYDLTDEFDLLYTHFSFVEDGEDLYLFMIAPQGQYKIMHVDTKAQTLNHLPDHVFPLDKVVYTANMFGGKVLPAAWTEERNMIFAAGGSYGERENVECARIFQGEQRMTALKVCPVSTAAAADGPVPPCDCVCCFIRHYEP
ncbi:unnamed protein product [Cuscuta campestris]|uniref:Uncharacterized protein n=1 Tax=Cuscuta campestris TaxID=132261 RepID=A0A484KWL4_9ASTE|nr:unnamed protein product [Cuscuta campestris]